MVHQTSIQLSDSDVRHSGEYLSVKTIAIGEDRRRAQADSADLVEPDLCKHGQLGLGHDVGTRTTA